ncbi:MAG: hypothetical protein R3C49_25135 [Planctomycetaceae bacterium]
MDRARIERQLKLTQQQLALCEKQLGKDAVKSRTAKWRHLDGDVRTLKRRLLAVKGLEEREAACLERRNNPGVEESEEG